MGPRLLVETVCEFVASHERSEIQVVDVAAGTGLVGLEVHILFLFFFCFLIKKLSTFYCKTLYISTAMPARI